MSNPSEQRTAWSARPRQAMAIRAFVLVAPIAASLAFVHFASRVVRPPVSSFGLYLGWWAMLTAAATLVLIAVDRASRRLLPLAALFKLSLVFPDRAPSRFRAALRSGTTESLERRLAGAVDAECETPVEAAERLLGLVAALDAHDPLTRGHSDRVRAYAQLIGEELHLSRDEIDLLNWAALLHDVGKLEVPTHILAKEGRPTPDEWQILRRHPELGRRLVAPLEPWLGVWLDAVLQHHERWDGHGYPAGAAGEQFALAGRIVAVADVFDVITSARSYKRASGAVVARAEIARCAGEQFDPRVARAFLNVSIGRLRFAMGPLSWLAHAPILGRVPLTPAVGTISGTFAAVAAAVSTGVVAPPTPPAEAAAAPPAAVEVARPVPADAGIAVRSAERGSRAAGAGHSRVVPATTIVRRVDGRPRPAADGETTSNSSPAVEDAAARRPPDGPTGSDEDVGGVAIPHVNAPPSFLAGADQAVLEGSGVHRVARWASAISPGGPREASQSVSFLVSSDNPALFAVPPAVSPDGTLSYTLAGDVSGSATVAVRARDDGGTAAGGVDTSSPQSFAIVVVPVNSPPSFSPGASQSVAEDSGARIVPEWASAISPGPAGEVSQSVSFRVSNDLGALFSAQPAVAADGTLTFTPAANASGTAIVTVRAVDDGGTANGGVDTSTPQSFSITVTPVADAPVAVDDSPSGNEDSPGITFDVLANDTDPDGDPLSLVSYDASSITAGTLTANGGGSFTYVPDSDAWGTATFAYVVGDGTGGTDGATVTITVLPQPDAPEAAADAYTVAVGTPLSVASGAGVRANDSDPDGDSLTVVTTPVVAPSSGTLTLAADGSFDYVPAVGFTGAVSFTYRVGDGTGLTADAVATITVVAAVLPPTLLYLTPSGASSETWAMDLMSPASATGVPDYDGDLTPGLTIKNSDGRDTVTDPLRRQEWTYAVPVALVLNGPVTLRLWSTTALYWLGKDVHPYVYLYDCVSGGSGCVELARNDVHVNDWNGLVPSWVYHEITVGSVTTSVVAGHELRLRLLVQHHPIWVAMTAAYPSALLVTPG